MNKGPDNPLNRWQSYIDEIIQEAQARGDFDIPEHLRGKPLGASRDEQFAGDSALANKVLKESGHAPPFLMKKREIDEAVEKERALLGRYARRRRHLLALAEQADGEEAEALRARAESDWQWALGKFEARLPAINKEIELFNLMNPIPSMFRMKLTLEREIARAEREA